MMNAMLISFGNGMMTAQIDWPMDGSILAIMVSVAFALLVMGLLRESMPDRVMRVRRGGTRFRPPLPKPLQRQQAA